MAQFSPEEIEEFIVEASELLDAAERELLLAEKGQSKTFYDSAFRAFHSIKGGAGMLGLNPVQAHMHKIESQWGELKGANVLSKEQSAYFFAALDCGRRLLKGEKASFDYEGLNSKPSVQAPVATPAVINPSPAKIDKKVPLFAVDDEPDLLDLLKSNLEDENFEITTFTDPEHLIASLVKNSPHIVVTDYKMPKKSGLDVLQAVKKYHPDVPVIMVTAHLSKEVLQSSLKDGGFFSALEKPYKQIDLLKECWAAAKHFELKRTIRRSLNLLVYQFSDLENFLVSQGKVDVAEAIKKELKALIESERTQLTRN